MSAPTPGPWTADTRAAGNHVGGFSIETVDGLVICGRAGWPMNREESTANAHLIAAAPTLLEALTRIMRHVEQEFVITGQQWATSIKADAEFAEAAIAKAQGRSAPTWDGADRRSGNGVEHAARDERRGPEGTR